MKYINQVLKPLLPASFREALRTIHRDIVFRRAMKKFIAAPEKWTQPGNRVLVDLIYGWGNESWSALDEYLAGSLGQALVSDGPILECGSGLSTLLVGIVAKSRGNRHWALEHTPVWAKRVQHFLDRYGVDSVTLCVSPLKDHGEFAWYDPPLGEMPESFALVICDGPPGSTKGGRYGLASVMREYLQPECVILLDDAGRSQEREVAARWEAELEAHTQDMGDAKPYIKLTVGAAKKRRAA